MATYTLFWHPSKKIHTPQTVFAVAQESEPGRTVRARLRPVVPGQHAPYQILINLDIEEQGNLLGDALATEFRVSTFHLDDRGDQFRRRSSGTRLATSFRREKQAVLTFHQCAMEAEYRGGLQDNC